MDLYAYTQIESLAQIAKDNGIEVPRLRGYRLMKNEQPISKEEIAEALKDCEVDTVRDLCQAEPFWNPYSWCHVLSNKTRQQEDYYLTKAKNERGYKHYVSVRWDRIHGKKRKILKLKLKHKRRRILEQYNMWNKYVGMDDVLYIHARIGGANWDYFNGNKLREKPWFLDKVDDSFDRTYCDIYAKIKEVEYNG